jgi:hypothetical protein
MMHTIDARANARKKMKRSAITFFEALERPVIKVHDLRGFFKHKICFYFIRMCGDSMSKFFRAELIKSLHKN